MRLTFNVPLYRFFSKESYVDSMINKGEVWFSTIKEFNTHANPQYRDNDEGGHSFKESVKMTAIGSGPHPKVITSQTIRKRRIADAWAFCGSCSPVSKAKKTFSVRIHHVIGFLQQLDFSIEQKFGKKLDILFGPISYYNEEMNRFSPHELPPYFSKIDLHKEDLEFRIVVIPPDSVNNLEPVTFTLPEPSKIFSRPIIL